MAKLNVKFSNCQQFDMCTNNRNIMTFRETNQSEFSLTKCISITCTDSNTISKICNQIRSIVKKSQISQKESHDTSIWIVNLLKAKYDTVAKDLLSALHSVLKACNSYSPEIYEELLDDCGLLWKFLNDDYKCSDATLESLKCLQIMTWFPENHHSKQSILTTDMLEKCNKVLLLKLYNKKSKDQNEIQFCEIVINSFRALLQIYLINNKLDKNLNKTIGACQYWMIYGLVVNSNDSPNEAIPSQQTVADVSNDQSKKGGKRAKLRKPKNIKPINVSEDVNDRDDSIKVDYNSINLNDDFKAITSSLAVTSESDLSDSENSLQSKLLSVQAKTRLAALNLLSILIKTSEKHVIFSYWWTFLPDTKSYSGGLAMCISKESNTASRMASLTALLSLLTASRSYLMQADTSKHLSMSFTPFSVALGISLESIHSLLSDHLSKERSVPVLVLVLKCIAAVVQASPYHKMGEELLSPIIANIKKLLLHKDWTIQVASLIVMGCIVSTNPPSDKIVAYLKNDVDLLSNQMEAVKVEDDINAQGTNFSWLIEICFQNLGWKIANDACLQKCTITAIPTRQESLQVLSVLSLQYFDKLIAPLVPFMEKVLSSSLEDTSIDICLHAAKCISSMGDAMQKSGQSCGESQMKVYVSFWSNMLHGALTKLLQSELYAPARAVACDCIGTIGEEIFMRLEEKQRILAATLLLGLSSDEDILVRATAVRALGICIMYQQWREDTCLINDCSEMVLCAMIETSPSVKVKATWALANITDALILNKENPKIEAPDERLYLRLLEAAIAHSHENDKIKANVMRTIGNIMFLIDVSHYQNPAYQITTKLALDKLKRCAKHGNNMKVRWNACHALGKALKNNALYEHLSHFQDEVFDCLCELIQSCRNLKVCIHASAALCSPTSRIQYGTSFIKIWNATLKTLNDMSHTEDFLEYNHKNLLIQQLCTTLSHMTCLLVNDDLDEILNSLNLYWEVAAQSLQQVVQKSEPQSETCQKLFNATKHVTTELIASSEKQRQCISILQNMFTWDY